MGGLLSILIIFDVTHEKTPRRWYLGDDARAIRIGGDRASAAVLFFADEKNWYRRFRKPLFATLIVRIHSYSFHSHAHTHAAAPKIAGGLARRPEESQRLARGRSRATSRHPAVRPARCLKRPTAAVLRSRRPEEPLRRPVGKTGRRMPLQDWYQQLRNWCQMRRTRAQHGRQQDKWNDYIITSYYNI